MKKKITALGCIVLALSMCISLASCTKNDKPKDKVVDDSAITTQADDNSKTTAELVTDKDGNTVPATDSKGNTVEGNKVETATENDSDNKNKKTTKKSDKKEEKETTKKKQTTTKKNTTTTTTIHYTTVAPLDNNLGEEISLEDEYALTANGAMFRLQQKYDPTVYVVNLIEETNDYATLYVFVLKNNDIYSKAKVNLKNGKTTETITKTNKKLTYTL